MSSDDIPFAVCTSGSNLSLAAVPGRSYLLKGLVFTTVPYASVSGFGQIGLDNVVQPFNAQNTQGFNFIFNPSTTDGQYVSVPFGDSGLVFMVNQPLDVTVTLGGSVPSSSLALWGVSRVAGDN